jgi:hypothetical protein
MNKWIVPYLGNILNSTTLYDQMRRIYSLNSNTKASQFIAKETVNTFMAFFQSFEKENIEIRMPDLYDIVIDDINDHDTTLVFTYTDKIESPHQHITIWLYASLIVIQETTTSIVIEYNFSFAIGIVNKYSLIHKHVRDFLKTDLGKTFVRLFGSKET